MLNDRRKRRRAGAIAAQHQHVIAMLRKPMMVMLPVWLAYFFAIKLFVKSLSAVTVPVVDMPLNTYLVIQGSVVVFAVMLVLLARAYASTNRA